MKEPIKYILTGDACSGPHLARKINEVIEHVNRLETLVEVLAEETAKISVALEAQAVGLKADIGAAKYSF